MTKPPLPIPTREVDKPLTATLRRRFYKSVGVTEGPEGAGVLLDGRAVRTPGRAGLVVPTLALAEALAAEWAAQGESIDPATMPLTALANTALDRVAPERSAILDTLVRYGGTDLLCYRADQPTTLVERQEAAWSPLLDWLATTHGLSLVVTRGLMPVAQPEPTLARLRSVLEGLDLWALTATQALAAAGGSVGLALAVGGGRLSAEEAFTLAHLDDLFQVERWGDDAEARARREALAADMSAAHRFLILARPTI
ncbi:ATP12 family chaperone protein [Pararhodospirillum photometricum]|nr:ATP12 family protein [Pararhodospirillum photometricum]